MDFSKLAKDELRGVGVYSRVSERKKDLIKSYYLEVMKMGTKVVFQIDEFLYSSMSSAEQVGELTSGETILEYRASLKPESEAKNYKTKDGSANSFVTTRFGMPVLVDYETKQTL